MGFFDKLFGSKKPTKPEAVAASTDKGAVCSPAAGRVEVTDQIPDPVFACEAMGKTVAVWPETGNVFAPIAGSVVSAMPHAFGDTDETQLSEEFCEFRAVCRRADQTCGLEMIS